MERAETISTHRSSRALRHGEGPAQQLGVLGFIVLLHVGLFVAMQAHMDQPTPPVAVPKEVFARFIAAEPEAAAAASQASAITPQASEAAPAKPARPPKLAKPALAKPSLAEPAPSPSSMPAKPQAPVSNAAPASNAPPLPTVKPEPPSTSSDAPSAANGAPNPPQAAPAAAVPAAPRTVSGVQYIRPPAPDYPALSRRMKEEGTVRLRILVNESGRAQNIELEKTSGWARLDSAARDAVQLALFKPHIEDGRAVPVYVSVPINFSLQ